MKVAIITTGDEILQGIITDTNSAWLSEKCNSLGHRVVWQFSVSDEVNDIAQSFRFAAQKADIVLISGGLGPTSDDITLQVAASCFEKELIKDEAILKKIRERFELRGLSMTESNEKQAYLLEGSCELPNEVGTAPGVQVEWENTTFFFLPGVPNELYQIFTDSIKPWLENNADECVAEKILRCFGLPEAEVDTKIKAADLCGAKLSFRAKYPEVLLKLVARGSDRKTLAQHVSQAAQNLQVCLGDVIYNEGEEELFAKVGALLQEKNLKLGVAESCTGGYLASCITDVSGASRYFDRAFITYSNEAKTESLAVDPSIIEKYGAVSEQVASAMAKGVLQKSNADFALALTGVAGPTGGTKSKPVGTVFIALASKGSDEAQVEHFIFSRSRTAFKQAASWTAMNMLRKSLT